MQMEKGIIAIGMFLLALGGCSRFDKGEGDMLYRVVTDKSGERIREGEIVELSVLEKTEEDSVIWRSSDYDRPALVKREKSVFRGDLFAALGLLSEGDSAVIKINIDSMAIKMGHPKPLGTKGRYVIYDVKIEHVVHRGKLNDSGYAAKIDAFLKARLERLRLAEPIKIKNYIADKFSDPVTTGSGLSYVITKRGSGPVPDQRDTMEINYTGMLMSGKIIDSNYPDVEKKAGVVHDLSNPGKIVYGMYGTTRGFNEALMMMPKGSKIKVLIPSVLAYGKEGSEIGIQAYTPLVYEIEMVNIIHPKEKAIENIMPDFLLYRMDESPFEKTAVEKGKKSLIILFDTDCDYCQNEILSIGKSYNQFKNVNVYLVSNNSKPKIQEFMNTYGKILNKQKNVTVLQDKNNSFPSRFLPKFEILKYPAVYVYSEKNELIKYFGGKTATDAILKAMVADQ